MDLDSFVSENKVLRKRLSVAFKNENISLPELQSLDKDVEERINALSGIDLSGEGEQSTLLKEHLDTFKKCRQKIAKLCKEKAPQDLPEKKNEEQNEEEKPAVETTTSTAAPTTVATTQIPPKVLFFSDDNKKSTKQKPSSSRVIFLGISLFAVFLAIASLIYLNSDQNAEQSFESHKIESEIIKDTRDGKQYKVVKIGKQKWMAENLNFENEGSFCYDDNPENCRMYGRLYTWYAAEDACPEGFHLPSNDEWQLLRDYIRNERKMDDELNEVGRYLKSANDWKNKEGSLAGNDFYGFMALPAGSYNETGDAAIYASLGTWAFFWSSSESASGNPYYMYLRFDRDGFFRNDHGTADNSYSVRCVKGDFKEGISE